MSNIDKIKELRARTNVPLAACKDALEATGGDIDGAIMHLREQGMLRVQDLVSRKTGAGTVGSYVHGNGNIGVLVVVRCETDFVANSLEFREFARAVAMHIAASNPKFIDLDQARAAETFVASETLLLTTQMDNDPKMASKPAEMKIKIRAGKLEKVLKDVTLLEQPFVRDNEQTVGQLRAALALKVGENIQITNFVRYAV